MIGSKHGLIVIAAALALGVSTATAQQSSDYSDRVRNVCTSDAQRLCSDHVLGSAEMRYCMEAKFRQISRDCVIALEDEGFLPRTARKAQAAR